MSKLFRSVAYVAVLSLLGACGTSALRWQPDVYTVRTGDTLYGIAFANGLDHRRLAQWNNLQLNQTIYPGQKLYLYPRQVANVTPSRDSSPKSSNKKKKTATPAKPKVYPSPPWRWPTQGEIVARFGDGDSLGQGLDIRGRLGAPVVAAAPGKVMYAGSGLVGYGKLIIIKHNESYLSAYGHNRNLMAKQGDLVEAGQRIAEMGVGPGKQPLLHFEIRVNGKAVDPLTYLPPR